MLMPFFLCKFTCETQVVLYIYKQISVGVSGSFGWFGPFGFFFGLTAARRKLQKTPRGGRTLRQNALEHEVFEGVAAKNAGGFASNEPRAPLRGPLALLGAVSSLLGPSPQRSFIVII